MSRLAKKRNLFLGTLKVDFSAIGITSDRYCSMISAVHVPFLCYWAIDWYASLSFPSSTSSGERVATTSAESCLFGFGARGLRLGRLVLCQGNGLTTE